MRCKIFCALLLFLGPGALYAANLPLSLLPLDNYSQHIDDWFNPTASDYHQPLLTSQQQQRRYQNFVNHVFVTNYKSASPWSPSLPALLTTMMSSLSDIENKLVNLFDNLKKDPEYYGYGENYRPYAPEWIQSIKSNMQIDKLSKREYQAENRAISITNLQARVLPTHDAYFYHYTLAGEGYPFDNLQLSSLWAGTPVYILAQSKDKAWDLVLTPDFIAWVDAQGIAQASEAFITSWQGAARKQLAAITNTGVSLIDQAGIYRFSAYIGSVFPIKEMTENKIKIDIPIADSKHHARMISADVSLENIALMPLALTKENLTKVMRNLIGRPYGWGGLYFYNDCSQELKSLLTPFGIWLPRHSSEQMTQGKQMDLSNKTLKERLQALMQYGHPMTTLIYIDGHIMLYLGNFADPNSANKSLHPLTYQNVWGLRTPTNDRRVVIGKAVLFPLLSSYPEDPALSSLADRDLFILSFLDEAPEEAGGLGLTPATIESMSMPPE